jgi:hypothetical protein
VCQVFGFDGSSPPAPAAESCRGSVEQKVCKIRYNMMTTLGGENGNNLAVPQPWPRLEMKVLPGFVRDEQG